MTVKQILFAILSTFSPLMSFAIDYYIATTDLKVRSGAGKEYEVSFTLQEGDEVEVLSKSGSWYKIRYLGEIGYAHSKYLKSKSDTKSYPSQQSDGHDSTLGVLIIILGVIGFFWLLPILIIISSSKTTSGEKIAWILAVLFISWFAWIFYMLLAPIKKKDL